MTGGGTVTITGTNFVCGATVNFGSNRRDVGERRVGREADRGRAARPRRHGRRHGDHPQGGTSATSSRDSYTYLPQAGAVFAIDTGTTA